MRCFDASDCRGIDVLQNQRAPHQVPPVTSQEAELESLLGLLALVSTGRATVKVAGQPVLSIDSDEKTLEVEADGAKEAGLRLSSVVRTSEGPSGMLEGSERVAGKLSNLGWRMTLLAGGDKVLTMGSGVSRLTGRISVSPLRLKKLLDALRQ